MEHLGNLGTFLARVRVVELHGEAGGGVAVAAGIDQVDPVIAGGVAESVEMGVEMVGVEWGKPPGLEENYGR